MAVARIGTSGWMYRHWRGVVYAPGVPTRSWLERYADLFDTVEVNATFYRRQSPETFASWRDRTPPGFSFAVKGHRVITHRKRLRDSAELVRREVDAASELRDKLGPMLWQLPPQFHRNDDRLAQYLESLPKGVRHVLEFRHESWLTEDVFGLLEGQGAAFCIADRAGKTQPRRVTTDWTYLRFHYGDTADGDYADDVLRRWSDWIREQLSGGIDVWAYFNNDWRGYAVKNAKTLRELVG